MPPSAVALDSVADLTYIAMGNMLPMPWAPFNGASPGMYNRAFKSSELVTVPPVMAYYLPASLNKYHTTTAKHVSRQHRTFVHKILSACKSAWGTWQDLASLVGLQVAGPTCIGTPGCLVGPPLLPLIMMDAPKATAQELKYSKAIAQAFSTAFGLWQLSVTVPGLPLWPPFAAFPGPLAPPTPSLVPLPLEACPAVGELAMLAPALALLMMANLGDPPPQAMWSLQLFTAVSVSLSLNFTQWVATSLWKTGAVEGGGPIPTFAPPVVPVGPVLGGQAVAPPAGLTTLGPSQLAAALGKLAMDAVEDMAEGDSSKDITNDMIGDGIDAVFAAFGTKAGKAKKAAEKAAKDAAKKEVEAKAKDEAEKVAKEEAEKAAKKATEKELEEQAKEKLAHRAQKEAKEEAEHEAKKIAKAKVAREARDQAEKEAKEATEKAAKKDAEREAAREAEKKAASEAEKKAAAEAREKAEKEAADAAKQKAEKEARAQAVQEAEAKAKTHGDAAAGKVAAKDAKAKAAQEEQAAAKKEADDAAKEEADKAAEAQAKKTEKEEADKEAEDAKKEAEDSEKEAQEAKAEEKEEKGSGKEWAKDQVKDPAKDVVKEQAKDSVDEAAGLEDESPADQVVEEHTGKKPKKKEKKPVPEKVAGEKWEGYKAAVGAPVDFEPEEGEGEGGEGGKVSELADKAKKAGGGGED